MLQKAVPTIHVPDVEAAAKWFENVGFPLVNRFWIPVGQPIAPS